MFMASNYVQIVHWQISSGRRRALTIICNVLHKRGCGFAAAGVSCLSASVVWKEMVDK